MSVEILGNSTFMHRTGFSILERVDIKIDGTQYSAVFKRPINKDGAFYIRNEHQALSTLVHEGIVSVLDYDNSSNNLFLENIEGVSLTAYMEQGVMPWQQTAMILRYTAEVLAYMHEGQIHNSYAHYDISPSNIIIRPDGAIKLIDFGTAFTPDSVPKHYYTEEVGTPHYMSPQKLAPAPQPEFGKESDVYALGVIGYTMLAGMEPFHETLGNLRRQIRTDIPLSIGCENPPLENLLVSCLEKQPENRPTAYELATQLQEI